ncbi:adenine methyltransferase [Candidatus Pacearchaeota archaeon]|nr:adenine methyltransferase [Candidatus Pacearchaeota archaeon]
MPTDEWYTPLEIFKAMGLEFDLDPCSPGPDHWVPAEKIYTKENDGLYRKWEGLVFMNPPFSGRNPIVPWLSKFMRHNNGIAIVPARTSSGWFHDYATNASAMLFPLGKTKFIGADGRVGKSPADGIVLLACGYKASKALEKSGLGFFIRIP